MEGEISYKPDIKTIFSIALWSSPKATDKYQKVKNRLESEEDTSTNGPTSGHHIVIKRLNQVCWSRDVRFIVNNMEVQHPRGCTD